MKKNIKYLLSILVLAAVIVVGQKGIFRLNFYDQDIPDDNIKIEESAEKPMPEMNSGINIDRIPEFDGVNAYVEINGNTPYFTNSDMSTTSFEQYSNLDYLGRCGVAYANLSIDTMPTEERGRIGMIKPSGWQIAKYDFIDGKYLYNRCHLIGFQLSGENANEKNLVTGTRYLNVIGMLPFENMTADYIKKTGNHILYRVTPIYDGDNLVCNGLEMEAYSVEDNGSGICFNIYCYNVQPGVVINYATGDNYLE